MVLNDYGACVINVKMKINRNRKLLNTESKMSVSYGYGSIGPSESLGSWMGCSYSNLVVNVGKMSDAI